MNARRFGGFVVDVATSELISRDLADRDVDESCAECGAREAPKRCDYPVKEPHRLCCEKRLCVRCAVHIFTRNDSDYCTEHARVAGIQLHPLVRGHAARARMPRDLIECRASCKEELEAKTREALALLYRSQETNARSLRA